MLVKELDFYVKLQIDQMTKKKLPTHKELLIKRTTLFNVGSVFEESANESLPGGRHTKGTLKAKAHR